METAKKEKIPIANDVLMKLLEWIPLRNLPNVNLASRRFWRFCDVELEGRKYSIQEIYVVEDANQIMVKRRRLPDLTPASFAAVEPPRNFKLGELELSRNIGEKAVDFLRVSKQLFVGAILHFGWRTNAELLDEYLQIFDRCSKVIISDVKTTITHQFFGKPAILNCCNLYFLYGSFELMPIFEWLHTPPTVDPNRKRQVKFGWIRNLSVDEFISQIKKRFSNDDIKRKFVVRFSWIASYPAYPLSLRVENQQTGEILFARNSADSFYNLDLIRCGRDEQNEMAYENVDKKEYSSIKILT